MTSSNYGRENFNYDYPDDLDLRPGSQLHQRILTFVYERARESRRSISDKFGAWNKIDRSLSAYISPEFEAKIRASQEDDDEQEFSEESDLIVIPVSYAILETLMTYLSAAFLVEPYFRYEGVEPSDMPGVVLLESIIAYQMRRTKGALNLLTMWRDILAYGFGGVNVGWTLEKGYRTVKKKSSLWSDLKGMFVEGKPVKQVDVVTTYEGNYLENVDPYMSLPDPNFPVEDVQNAEFFGWLERTNFMSLLESERDDDSLFNVKYLKAGQRSTSVLFQEAQSEKAQYQLSSSTSGIGGKSSDSTRPVDIIWMYSRVIPSDLGLGDGEYPEIWLFGVAGDKYVIKAEKVDADHNMIPVAIAAPESDGHNVSPISKLEVIQPIQGAIDWLMQSHIANVRKAINDVLVVDPQLINMKDLRDPKPGRLVRMRRSAWGRGVKDAVMQLNVSDVTSAHIGNVEYLTSLAKQLSGAVDSIQGIRRKTSERVTATEASDIRSSALSRLEKMAKVISIQAHNDIAYMMASNTRQYLSEPTFIKIVGDYASVILEEYGIRKEDWEKVMIEPSDIDVNFDVIPHDGMIPGSGNPNVWMQLFQTVSGSPVLAQTFDLVRMFEHLARLLGAKNISGFILKNKEPMKVMPDENVEKEVEKGNLVPLNQAGGME